jgi:hypothetical protein
MMPLTLRRTVIAGRYPDSDFCAYDDGLQVGRIRLAHERAGRTDWDWMVNIDAPLPPDCKGTAGSLDAAKAVFRAAWERIKPTLGAAKLAALKDWQDTEGRRHERARVPLAAFAQEQKRHGH